MVTFCEQWTHNSLSEWFLHTIRIRYERNIDRLKSQSSLPGSLIWLFDTYRSQWWINRGKVTHEAISLSVDDLQHHFIVVLLCFRHLKIFNVIYDVIQELFKDWYVKTRNRIWSIAYDNLVLTDTGNIGLLNSSCPNLLLLISVRAARQANSWIY